MAVEVHPRNTRNRRDVDHQYVDCRKEGDKISRYGTCDRSGVVIVFGVADEEGIDAQAQVQCDEYRVYIYTIHKKFYQSASPCVEAIDQREILESLESPSFPTKKADVRCYVKKEFRHVSIFILF